MKQAEQLAWATGELKDEITALIKEFVEKYGECSVEINTSARFIMGARDQSIYAGHEVEVNVVI